MTSWQGVFSDVGRRLRAAALAAALMCLLAPAVAAAGTVAVNGGELEYNADDGETNTITVVGGSDGKITVRDAGREVLIVPFADPGCTHPTPDSATCPATSVNIDPGDLTDTVDASAATVPTTSPIGNVFLNGGEGDDTLIGSPSVDTLNGDTGHDDADGGAGSDFLTGGDGNDDLIGGEGDDEFEVVAFATLGNDTAVGGGGNDTLAQPQRSPAGISDGADTFHGGGGVDTADYAASSGALTLSLDGLPNDGYSGESDNLGADVEVVTGGPAPDTITGSEAGNVLEGGGGDDSLRGMGGDDEIRGGDDSGSDSLDGGPGADRLTGGAGDDALDGAPGDDIIDGGGGSDNEGGGEGVDIVAGGAGIDTISGGPGDDALRGGDAAGVGADGADVIRGDGGVDRLAGEGGDDTLDGGTGSDILTGGEGKDAADYRSGSGSVSITIDDEANDGGAGENDNVISDIEDVHGGDFESSIVGTPGSNALAGGQGEDYVDGKAGADSVIVGDAGDTVRSRDGIADDVECGGGSDFAIADRMDNVRACELVDTGRGKPVNGRRVLVKPNGTNLLRRPGVRRFVPLQDNVALPLGSTLDPVAGGLTLVAASPRGGRQTAVLRGGAFLVKQRRRTTLTEVRLAGGNLSNCNNKRFTAEAAQRPRRRLFARTRGRFRTRGRHSSATSRGTSWLMEDRCNGTLTRVRSGSVIVRDFGRRRSTVVRAGESYLARARRRR